jgi:Spy/CpxP family protein refolding chaperone
MTRPMKRLTFGAAVTASIVAATLYVAAQGPGGGFGGPGRGGPGRFGGRGLMGLGGPAIAGLERVGLTDAQKDQIKTIMQSHQDDMRSLATRERDARQALNNAITADVADEGLIRARSADVAAVEADMAVAQARIRGEILQILTADQQAQLKQFQSQMKQRAEQRGQGRRGN